MWRLQRDTSKVLAKATRRMELVFINNEKMGRAGADERVETENWLWNTQVHEAYQIKVQTAGVVQKLKHVQCC